MKDHVLKFKRNLYLYVKIIKSLSILLCAFLKINIHGFHNCKNDMEGWVQLETVHKSKWAIKNIYSITDELYPQHWYFGPWRWAKTENEAGMCRISVSLLPRKQWWGTSSRVDISSTFWEKGHFSDRPWLAFPYQTS